MNIALKDAAGRMVKPEVRFSLDDINRMAVLVRKIAAYRGVEYVNVEEILSEARAIVGPRAGG